MKRLNFRNPLLEKDNTNQHHFGTDKSLLITSSSILLVFHHLKINQRSHSLGTCPMYRGAYKQRPPEQRDNKIWPQKCTS